MKKKMKMKMKKDFIPKFISNGIKNVSRAGNKLKNVFGGGNKPAEQPAPAPEQVKEPV